MRYKRRILGTVALSLIAITFGMYFFAPLDKATLDSESNNIATPDQNVATEVYSPSKGPIPHAHTKAVLENAAQIYSVSQSYSQCEAESKEVWERLEAVRDAIKRELSNIEDTRLLRDAVFLLESEGHFKTYKALLELYRLQVANESQLYPHAPYRATQDEMDRFNIIASLLQEVFDAAMHHDIEQTVEAAKTYRQEESNIGYVVRNKGQTSLWSPDTIVGHVVATAPLGFVDDITEKYPVSPLLFTQAVRSGANNEALEKLLSAFDFNNTPIYTKYNKLQTALQAAIEIESLDAMRLILSQPNIRHTEFFFNPLNTIVNEALRAKEVTFTDIQKAMMSLLVEHGFAMDIVLGPLNESQTLAGYPVILERPIIEQLKALSIPNRLIERLRMHPDSALPLSLQDQLKRDAYQSQVLNDDYNERSKTCFELKLALRSLVPPLIRIEDVFSYIPDENSFNENVQLLSHQSLTLVDAYYSKMEREPANNQAVDAIAASTVSLQDIPPEVRTKIDEMPPADRHRLAEAYCDKFGKRYMEEIFDTVQYINFNVFSFEACLAGTPEDYTETKLSFYLNENTFPGIIYSKIADYDFEQALDALSAPSFQRQKDLKGYPYGTDALMLVLDLKLAANREDKKDFKTLIEELIAKTKLKDGHFKRLHRLKVDHFFFFEEIASLHPQIRQAVDYPLVKYRTKK